MLCGELVALDRLHTKIISPHCVGYLDAMNQNTSCLTTCTFFTWGMVWMLQLLRSHSFAIWGISGMTESLMTGFALHTADLIRGASPIAKQHPLGNSRSNLLEWASAWASSRHAFCTWYVRNNIYGTTANMYAWQVCLTVGHQSHMHIGRGDPGTERVNHV